MSKQTDLRDFLISKMDIPLDTVYAEFSPGGEWVDIFDDCHDNVQIVGKEAMQALGEFLIECAERIKE